MDCPACGSPVTLGVGPDRPLSTSLSDAVLAAEEDEQIEVTRDCWDCGWHETRALRVVSIDTTAGDETAVERARLIDKITDELAAVESKDTLEETLAAIRRQRATDPTTTDTDDATE
jgi:hypothetical protein